MASTPISSANLYLQTAQTSATKSGKNNESADEAAAALAGAQSLAQNTGTSVDNSPPTAQSVGPAVITGLSDAYKQLASSGSSGGKAHGGGASSIAQMLSTDESALLAMASEPSDSDDPAADALSVSTTT